MIHWQETAEIAARLAELAASGERAALATVVRISGSAYRRPGARLLVAQAGETVGSVSGGCLEADVREVAASVLATGRPWLRHYETGDEDIVWGLGLGCNGHVDIFVQPATDGPLAALTPRLRALFTGDNAFAVATVVAAGGESAGKDAGRGGGESGAGGLRGRMLLVETDGTVHGSLSSVRASLQAAVAARARSLLSLAHGESAAMRTAVSPADGDGAIQVFFEVMAPPPHLVVCGGGEDAKSLVAYAADAGFRVTLLDHRPAMLAAEHFPQAARRLVARPEDPEVELPPAGRSLAVVKTHSLAHDREWVGRLLAAGFPYIGVLGPRGRTDSILRALGAGGDAAERVFGPVGLDLGADGPRQVAMSIVAELLAFHASREPRHLSERQEAIHAAR